MENRKRLNREKKIDNPFFKVKICSTNIETPSTIYIEGSTFIEPKAESDYINDISIVKHNFKKILSKKLRNSEYFDTKYILDFNVPYNAISLNKKTFVYFQCHVKQKGKKLISFNNLKTMIEPNVSEIADELTNEFLLMNYEVSKTKK